MILDAARAGLEHRCSRSRNPVLLEQQPRAVDHRPAASILESSRPASRTEPRHSSPDLFRHDVIRGPLPPIPYRSRRLQGSRALGIRRVELFEQLPRGPGHASRRRPASSVLELE